MFWRVLQLVAVTVYMVGMIAAVAYYGGSFFWLVPLLAPAIWFIFRLPDLSYTAPALPPRQPRPEPSAVYRASIAARIAQVKAVPHRNKTQYIDAISRGIPYSDDRIDYLEFPDRLVLCEHLRPLESAMRAARVPMDHVSRKTVVATANLRTDRIQRYFPLDPCVQFGLGPGPDNHAPDVVVIQCKTCLDSIEEQGLYGSAWPAD